MKPKQAYDVYYYAKYVIKGRWIEAEEIIKKDPEYAYLYAKDVMCNKRPMNWIEVEPYIRRKLLRKYLC